MIKKYLTCLIFETTNPVSQSLTRPWHEAQVIAHTCAATHANQEKEVWAGDEKPIG